MNNNTQEDYCSVEIGKLLCDKGFPQITEFQNECPTHALAIKWIRENFGIHISIFPSSLTNNEVGDLKGCDTFYARIDNRWNLAHSNDGKNIPYRDYVAYTKYNSWEEAESAALLYTLQNLIP